MLKEERKKRKKKTRKRASRCKCSEKKMKHEAAHHLTWLESQVCTGNRGQRGRERNTREAELTRGFPRSPPYHQAKPAPGRGGLHMGPSGNTRGSPSPEEALSSIPLYGHSTPALLQQATCHLFRSGAEEHSPCPEEPAPGRTPSAGLKAPDTPQLRLMRHRAVPRIAISSWSRKGP